MHRWPVFAVVFVLASGPVARAQAPASSVPASRDVDRLATLLEHTGLKYQKAGDGVWLLDFAAENKVVRVLVAASGGLAVFATTLKGAPGVDVTKDDLLAINKLNAEVDRVKIGLDDDRDLFLRVDLTLRTLDAEDLKVNASQVAAAAQKAAAALAPRFALR